MEVQADLRLPCRPDELTPWVADLGAYPQWMGLVHRAVREPGEAMAWTVDLRARLGPLARSKRLRMERSGFSSPTEQTPGEVRFERRELDGRRHGRWELTARYGALDGGTTLAVDLRYDGAFWTAGLLERVLLDEIERSKARLLTLVSGAPGGPTR